jgi:septum formation protein
VSADPRLVLASASPRRRRLLAELGLPFETRATETDETPATGESPRDLVVRLALAKARAAARPDEIALGADTEVAVDGRVLGKPADADDARRMLRLLSDRAHEVWSGVALARATADGRPTREWTGSRRSLVTFRKLDDAEIDAYVASGDPFDKAGAYAIQGGAAGFVAAVDGDVDNVVGLPLALVRELLLAAGVTPRT